MLKNGLKEFRIKINGNSVDRSDIIECINKYNEILLESLEKAVLLIEADNRIIDFDFSLIGHFILFKDKMPGIKIIIQLHDNYSDIVTNIGRFENSFLWKLKQSMVHAYFSIGFNVFSIIDGSGKELFAEYHKDNWFVLSKKILPYVYLNEVQYEKLFFNEIATSFIDDIKILNFDFCDNDDDDIYQACRRYLFGLKGVDYIKRLSGLAFFGALKEAKLLLHYFDYKKINHNSEIKYDIRRVGHVQDSELISEYKKRVYSIFDELLDKAPIYSLIYYVLVSSDLLPSIIKNDNINNYKKILIDLWDFTCELVGGINELAKNIIQHTTTKTGVIGGYIDGNEMQLRLSVFDHSKKGVIETLLESTRKAVKDIGEYSLLKGVFIKDLDVLENSEFRYKDLFEYRESFVLNHQMKRATAHLGLLIFSKLIENNKGSFISYTNRCDSAEIYNNCNYIYNGFPIGTGFDIRLPIKSAGGRHNLKGFVVGKKNYIEDKQSIESLLEFKEVMINEGQTKERNKNGKNIFINIKIDEVRCFKGSEIDDVWKDLLHKYKSYSECMDMVIDGHILVCFDLSSIINIDPSDLFRILGLWELEYPKVDLVIIGIPVNLYKELYSINRLYVEYFPGMSFWNDESVTLFYSYYNIVGCGRLYFADALWGKNENDFMYINALIAKNNYNVTQCFEEMDCSELGGARTIGSVAFFRDSALLPLDLMIRDKKNITLFEINTSTLLEKELDGIKDDKYNGFGVEKLIKSLPGYKISNSHFRLGSKIHMKDFYYAKRLFQNSFYSSRFAYIIASYLMEKYFVLPRKSSVINELTVIGYGIYSELLISTIRVYIKAYCDTIGSKIDITHNIYDDAEDLRLLKGYEKIKKNVVIVIPIATTLSTSMKIDEKIRQEYSCVNVLEHINTIIVTNGNVNNRDKSFVDKSEIEYRFGWRKILKNVRAIKVMHYFDGSNIKNQRYLLPLFSRWYSVDECEICYPSKIKNECFSLSCKSCLNRNVVDFCPLSEKPLHTADKTSKNPELIFNYPKGKKYDENNSSKYLLSTNSLVYRHITRNSNHFQYHIYDDVFYRENYKEVNKWLFNVVKIKIYGNDKFGELVTDNILIIAPKHFSNTVFVNAVNEIVCGGTANILHYDFQKHNIENFILFYGETIKRADKVLFVDDALITGGTFKTASLYIKQIGDKGKYFDCAIFLINRSNLYVFEEISDFIKGVGGLLSFVNINLPSLRDDNTECKLCCDKRKYEEIKQNSILIRFDEYYDKKIQRLNLVDLSKMENELRLASDKYNSENDILKIEAIHRLYEYFYKFKHPTDFENSEFYVWKKHFLENTVSPYFVSYMKNEFGFDDVSAVLLKVLALSPFNKYMLIRNRLFVWINDLLNDHIEQIKKRDIEFSSYEQFRDLKFLIRRASVVGSNYLISEKFLRFICHIYQSGWLEYIKNNAFLELDKNKDIVSLFKPINEQKNHKIIKAINNFMVYVVAQIKELIYENEARSIVLEKRIFELTSEFDTQRMPSKFLRLLRDENCVLINSLFEKLSIRKNSKKIQEVFDGFAEEEHYQYRALREYFRSSKSGDIEKSNMDSFLTVLSVIDDANEKEDLLSEKVRKIGDSLKSLISDIVSNCFFGEYILIKYNPKDIKEKLDNIMLVYNSGYAEDRVNDEWNKKSNYITDFIDGVTDEGGYQFTIDLLEYDKSKLSWNSVYASDPKQIYLEYLSDSDDVMYVFVLRLYLCGDDYGGKNSMGVIVFYSQKNIFDLNLVRYLLLLKDHISNFVFKYYKNFDFAEWDKNNAIIDNITAFSHGSDVYEYIMNYVAGEIDDKYKSELILTASSLLINQQKAYKFIEDFEKSNRDLFHALKTSDLSAVCLKIDVVKTKIEFMIKTIFGIEHPRYPRIESFYNYKFVDNDIKTLDVYPSFFYGMLFELIYNIRKRYGFYVGRCINKNCIIQVRVNITSEMLVISNTQASLVLNHEKISEIRDNMKRRGVRKGLNMINYVSEILYEKGCEISLHDDVFFIKIPLKK